jgi:hypothetical protein
MSSEDGLQRVVGVVSYFGSHIAPPRIGLRLKGDDGTERIFRLTQGQYNDYIARNAPGLPRWNSGDNPSKVESEVSRLIIDKLLPYPADFHSN